MTTTAYGRPTWRVEVDGGGAVAPHDDPTAVRIVLEAGLLLAEVQVTRVGAALVIVAAGQVLLEPDTRGYARVKVSAE